MSDDFQAYVRRWQAAFPLPRDVRWEEGGWLSNAYCPDCRFCCGPQDSPTPFPMPLLPSQYRPDLEEDFHLLDATTPCLDERGCKSCGPRGCRLPRPRRPIACGLFPVVLTQAGLFLYQCCPAALHLPLRDWIPLGERIRDWLLTLAPADRQRLSMDLDAETLAVKYTCLHLPVPMENS